MKRTSAIVLSGSLAFGIVCFAVLASAQQQRHPDWIGDSKTGCKVWNPSPEPQESISWSGTCKGGYADGKGTLQWFEKGKATDRYEGQYQHGKRNGFGILIDSEGKRIAGRWIDDDLVPEGEAT